MSTIQHTHTFIPISENVSVLCFTATFAFWPRLHSFSIGLENSPDHLAARKAAHYLGTVHHEYVFTVQEGLDAIPEVVYHLETYDVTTVRASTPMYLLSRKIKAMGVKMVLSGEGSDEIFGGESDFPLQKNLRKAEPPTQVISISTRLRTHVRSTRNASAESKICTRPIASVLISAYYARDRSILKTPLF